MKFLKKLGWVALGSLLIIQFIPTEKNNGAASSLDAFLTETKPSVEVRGILKKACYDCHSNITTYPWYHKIAPVNFWMNHHVEEGKEHLNFSDWSAYVLKKRAYKIEEVREEVEEKHMPIDSYTWTHANAKLSEAEISLVVNWVKEVQNKYAAELAE